MSSNPTRDEVIRRMDLVAEYAKWAGPDKVPDMRWSGDWRPVRAYDRKDDRPSAAINIGNDPSQRGIYVDKGATGKDKWGIFDLFALIPGTPFITGRDAYHYYKRETGVFSGNGEPDRKPTRPKPTLADVEAFQKNLSPETKQFLREKRGLSEESLTKFRVGWNIKNERNSIPVFDEGNNLVNIRFHNSKKDPKTLNWAGAGEARLWGLERLTKAAPGSTVIITEGEFDGMLADQETGYIGVSSTNGTSGFKPEWVKHFHGHHVVLLYDSDPPGREAVQTKLLPYFKSAVEAGDVLSIKVLWLYDMPVDKAHKDITDWIIKDGGSGARLKEMIQEAVPWTYPEPVSHLELPVPLESFEQIDHAEYAGKRVAVPLQVYGENTVAYHAVTKVKVSSCPAIRDGKCAGITDPNDSKILIRSCMQPIDIPLGERVMVAAVRATEGQLQKLLRDYVCDKDRRPALTYKDEDRLTVREVYAHQVVGAMAAERVELVEKPIYIIGGNLVEIGKYQATGRVITAYRDQQPTLLVDTMERVEEDYQAFSLEKSLANLKKLQRMKPQDIVEDLSLYVTRIYGRHDIHLGNLLVLLSPLEIDFPGEGKIRGRLACINIGDTGTGKTTVVQSLCEAAGVGLQVSGMTASRTGITYGCEHDERKGWRIKAGAFLKMNRQILVVDEAQDLKSEDLKTMAEGLETGLTRIDRIQNKVFESATRVIFNCNPRHPKKIWEQRTMDGYRYGCEAIKGIFPQMMIRRIDFAMYSTAWDVDKEQIFFPTKPEGVQQVLSADLRALIFYAWNLKPEQIIIKEDVAYYIRQVAKLLSDTFGAADDLPLVYAEDFRKTLARLSVAYAILDLSTEDFAQVQVGPQHVVLAQKLLERIYSAENCNLHKYAKTYSAAHGLADLEEIKKEINKKLEGPIEPRKRFYYIMHQLLHCQGEDDRVRVADITDEFGVDRKTVQRDVMGFFQRFHLINPKMQSGYKPEPKLNRLIARLEREDPKKYNFDRPYKEVYPDDSN